MEAGPTGGTYNHCHELQSVVNSYSTRLPGISIILSHREVKGTPFPSNSTYYIDGTRLYLSKTQHGLNRFSRSYSRVKIGIRYEGPMFPAIF